MQNPPILKIALPTPLRRVFDYLPPAGMSFEQCQTLPAGIRLEVPFANQTLIGVLLDVTETSELGSDQLKTAHRILDTDACLTPEVLAMVTWAADYYHHPLGDALATALPALLRRGETLQAPQEMIWRLTPEGLGLPEGALARSPKQAACFAVLLQQQTIPATQLERHGLKRETLRKLQDKGLVEEVAMSPSVQPTRQRLRTPPLALNLEQSHALNQMRYREFGIFLLEGATGSGKTEVYMQAVEQVLQQGKTALILVPEIGLTPQLFERFSERFTVPIVAIHSGLNDTERLNAWLKARFQQAHIVIGTRSAIFLPLANLGLIIIDEEHDLSFKQQEGFRYSARDLAAVRAQRLRIPLVLGTATPSLESLFNAANNRYQHLRLTERAGNARPPLVDLIGIRGKQLQGGLAPEVAGAIEQQLQQGKQVLVFLNRRGFAPVLICRDCAWIAGCHQCSARMTIHQQPAHLRCHHCDQQKPVPKACPDCRSNQLEALGQGTQRSEESLRQLFPNTDIIRVDRDSTRRKRAFQTILDQVHRGDPCILVGTQMLAKGHHFPNVTLVVIVDIDSSLFSGDFRGPERMGQLLIQVAGRAGRDAHLGRVMIQSFHCEHPNLQSLVKEGYHRFARRLLRERQLALLPPYRYLALVRSESKRPENAVEFLRTARQVCQHHYPANKGLAYLGPLPALMERKKDRFCFHLQIAAQSRRQLHAVAQHLCLQMDNHALSRRTRWSIDIDPQDMS